MANSLTSYTISDRSPKSSIIKQIDFNTDTGGSGSVSLTLDVLGDNAALTITDVAAGNANSESGFVHAHKCELVFTALSYGDTGLTTLINELRSNPIAYVKVTYQGGEAVTLDSGVNDIPVMYFSVVQGGGGSPEGRIEYQVSGTGILAQQNVSVA